MKRDPATLDSLGQQLAYAMRDRPQDAVVVNADEGVGYGLVVRVMDRAKRIGVRKFALATRAERISAAMPDLRSGMEARAFRRAALAALALEAAVLPLLGLGQARGFGRPGRPADDAGYIEAQVMPLPEEAHLAGREASASVPEAVLSRVAGRGKPARPDQKPIQDQNQTQAGPGWGATHGAVALYAPAPVIPAYLRDRELKSSVVIEFTVTAAGQVTPRLAGLQRQSRSWTPSPWTRWGSGSSSPRKSKGMRWIRRPGCGSFLRSIRMTAAPGSTGPRQRASAPAPRPGA